jgi:hypothetical protein
MATVLSIKRHEISGSCHFPSRRYLSVISGIAYLLGSISSLVIIALFLFPFALMFGFLLKYIGL